MGLVAACWWPSGFYYQSRGIEEKNEGRSNGSRKDNCSERAISGERTVSKLSDWLSTDERRVAFAEEALIVDVAERIWAAMASANVTKSEIAERLGKSKAFISQMLNGSRNMTLRSLADIAHSIGFRVSVSLERQDVSATWQPLNDAILVQFDRRQLPVPEPVDEVAADTWTPILNRAA
jgi:transcriptional regulator with XRE-family HTH domain